MLEVVRNELSELLKDRNFTLSMKVFAAMLVINWLVTTGVNNDAFLSIFLATWAVVMICNSIWLKFQYRACCENLVLSNWT